MRLLFLLLFYFIIFSVFSQNNYTISGYVEDNENGENIFGVNIYSAEKNDGVKLLLILLLFFPQYLMRGRGRAARRGRRPPHVIGHL